MINKCHVKTMFSCISVFGTSQPVTYQMWL